MPSIAGVRLQPLPYQSSFSCLLLLAWYNALARKDLDLICTGNKHASLGTRSFLNTDWILPEVVYRKTTWALPHKLENRLARIFRTERAPWLQENLRFCPCCLEAGYHTFWFQFVSLTVCPIHDCVLQLVCQSCGQRTSSYSLSDDFFAKPYSCSRCAGPLSGVEFCRASHIEFRDHSRQLHDAFFEFQRWIERLETDPLICEWLGFRNYGWQAWCNVADVKRQLAHSLFPFPDASSAKRYKKIETLRWRIQMVSKWSTGIDSKRKLNRRYGMSEAVFRCVYRRLAVWIFGEYGEGQCDFMYQQTEAFDWPVDPHLWDAKSLAFVIFCGFYALEQRSCYSETLRHISFRYNDAIPVPTWEGRVSRLAFRNFLLGMYAGIYHRVVAAQSEEVTSWSGLKRMWQDQMITFICEISHAGCESGCVIFPHIEGLPVERGK